jgi:hypothetical protein
MTTRVVVLNEGPDPVQVKVMNLFPAGAMESKYREPPIRPGAWKAFYVHVTQKLEVEEVKE